MCIYLMRIKLHCTVTAEVALCQPCQLGCDYSLHLQGTSDPQWSLSLCKRAMGGEDQSFDCQLKPANNSLTCCYSISRNHGSEKWVPPIVVTFKKSAFFTSMIMGGTVFQKNVAKKPRSRFISLCDDLVISYVGAFFWKKKHDRLNMRESADPSRRVVAIILCKIQTVAKIQNPKSEIQNPKSKIQNPKCKIQDPRSKIQDPKSKIQNPNGRVWGCHKKNGYYDNPKSKIQNPKSEIQNPKSKIQNPKSKIQNPKSKIQNPKSKIQDPKSKIQDPKSKIQNPKSKIQNPKSKIQNPNGLFGFWIFGFWILEFGFAWPGWGGYVANALVWMGWPPKFGVVGGDSNL